MTTTKTWSLLLGFLFLFACMTQATPDTTYVALPEVPQVNDDLILEISLGDSQNQANNVETLSFTHVCEGVKLDPTSSFYLDIDNSWILTPGFFTANISLAADSQTLSISISISDGPTSGYGLVCKLRGGVVVKVEANLNKFSSPNNIIDHQIYPNPCMESIRFPETWSSSLTDIYLLSANGHQKAINWTGNVIDTSAIPKGSYVLQFRFPKKVVTKRMMKI